MIRSSHTGVYTVKSCDPWIGCILLLIYLPVLNYRCLTGSLGPHNMCAPSVCHAAVVLSQVLDPFVTQYIYS